MWDMNRYRDEKMDISNILIVNKFTIEQNNSTDQIVHTLLPSMFPSFLKTLYHNNIILYHIFKIKPGPTCFH